MSEKSRVFISCGQSKETEEPEVANQIAGKLEELGFEPYIAIEEQRLEGVKESIFKRMQNSEYFLFIDFKRERLFKGNGKFTDTGSYRGSLFSHQELAIATFKEYEVLAFQEEGVKKDDGILKFIQANCMTFTDRKTLPEIVARKVEERNWNPNWRNELVLKRDEADFKDANNQGIVGRYFHIRVINNHKDRVARNCIAYVERITRADGTTRCPELTELKWKGTTTESVSIAPGSFRYLDAFHINSNDQTTANLGLNPFIVDWQGYVRDYQVDGSGDYGLDYVVFSENFPSARARFNLHIGTAINDVTFKKP
jgi:hypothetical protein